MGKRKNSELKQMLIYIDICKWVGKGVKFLILGVGNSNKKEDAYSNARVFFRLFISEINMQHFPSWLMLYFYEIIQRT